ncbi:unnamed protein product, partial [Ixodes hexagonus]
KKSASHIVPAANLPAFAYKDHAAHAVASRQASVASHHAGDRSTDGHSKLSQRPLELERWPSRNHIIMAALVGAALLIIVVFVVLMNMLKGPGDQTSTTTRSTRAG